MVPLIAILLLAASTQVQLVDEVYRIPPNEWRYVAVGLKQQPARVIGHFSSISGSREIRLALLRRDDLEKLRNGQPHGMVALSSIGPSGALSHNVLAPGDYVLVIDNMADAPAEVHLIVALDFTRRGPFVTQLSPRRQLVVVAISLAFFLGVVTWSARRILRAVRR